jgi:hypothetical protein
MYSHVAELNHLTLLVERLRDADALLAEDSAALRAKAAEAIQALEAGDLETSRRQVESLVRFTEALVQTDALDLPDGQAIIETAYRLLAEDAE